MITSEATVTDINHTTKRVTVETIHEETYLIEVPWYQLSSYLIGMSVKIKYADGDQFAVIA